MTTIAELKTTIERLYACQASHTRTERVRQEHDGRLIWAGAVEVFALVGHDQALRCYAWGGADERGQEEITTVLAIPPVISAETAVLAALAAKVQQLEGRGE